MLDLIKYNIAGLAISHRFDAKLAKTTVFVSGLEEPVLTFNLQGDVIDRHNNKIGKVYDNLVDEEACFVYRSEDGLTRIDGLSLTHRHATFLTEGLVAKDYIRSNYHELASLVSQLVS